MRCGRVTGKVTARMGRGDAGRVREGGSESGVRSFGDRNPRSRQAVIAFTMVWVVKATAASFHHGSGNKNPW